MWTGAASLRRALHAGDGDRWWVRWKSEEGLEVGERGQSVHGRVGEVAIRGVCGRLGGKSTVCGREPGRSVDGWVVDGRMDCRVGEMGERGRSVERTVCGRLSRLSG